MEEPNQFTMCRDLVAGLADGGVSVVFVSPGSRNTPITLAVAADPRITDLNIRDERSAGFMALGHAKATGRPAAVVSTSGSAAAHYFPAVVEADQSGTPLIVLTSDRPLRLRGTGAPQTMDQVALYGAHVKDFVDAVGFEGRSLAARLLDSATSGFPGVAHANLPFDEPLVPAEPITPSGASPVPKGDGLRTECEHVDAGLLAVHSGRRVLIVAGGQQRPEFAGELARVADALGAPVLADPQTRVLGENVIRHADLLVGAHGEDGAEFVLDRLRPDVVVRLGPLPTSKPLFMWMERSGVDQILVSDARLADPLRSASMSVECDPTAFLASQVVPPDAAADGYLEHWRALDRIAGDAMREAIAGRDWPSEPATAHIVGSTVPSGSILWAASSRPIRDLDAFSATRDDIRILANRGVNGIDGTISSAVGAALGGTHVTLLIGDLAVLHDATALSEAVALEVPLRIIAVNNDGGGIFSFLPQAQSAIVDHETFERHWGTPHGLSLSDIARAMRMKVRTVESAADLGTVVAENPSGPELIEVATDRARLLEDHRAVRHAVAAALLGRRE